MARRAVRVLLCAAAVLAGGAPAAHAAGFLAGAAVEVTTPPAAGSAAGNAADARFAPQFATVCAAFPAHGRFALQEPFVDSNGNGQWDAGEPYCDANGNGHWDGIYADNGFGPARGVHDDIDVRAFAVSDGTDRPVVYASVQQIGIFDAYTEEARTLLRDTYKVDADMVVSADHNESSPDSIGLYGAAQTPVGVGVRSGIDEYYMSYLDDKVAQAAADAVHALKPATLYANQVEGPIADGVSGNDYPLLPGLQQRISDQFPTAVALPNDDRIAAVDPKLGVLQARGSGGSPIFTVMSLAAHNQEMGFSPGAQLSADWPGAFEHAYEAQHGGTAIFLVGDNGSEEDPATNPYVIEKGSENHTSQATQFVQAQATGQRFAQVTADAAGGATALRPGPVRLTRKQVCVPLENNGFLALAAAGEFGRRQGWACDANGNPVAPVPNGFVAPTASAQFRTFLGYTDIGPDLQLIDNPSEAFPALMLGSPFGVEDESCNRPNAQVPTWQAHSLFRFQVGLADDLIGYMIPAWAFASETPGLFNNDTCYQDMHGHGHKLESESVGPSAAGIVANGDAAMLGGDPIGHVDHGGRFVLPTGSLSRWPTGAVGARLADGTLIGGPVAAGFGGRAVDRSGLFMDYDGQPQATPDVTTRGMILLDSSGCPTAREFLDVFPSSAAAPVGAVQRQAPLSLPACNRPGLVQPGAARTAGLTRRCADRTAPRSRITRVRLRGGRLVLRGRASDAGRCHGRVARVVVTFGKRIGRTRCRFLGLKGRLGRKTSCRRGVQLLARGTTRWRLSVRARVPHGTYIALARAIDTAANVERARRRGANVARLRRR